MTLDQSCDLTVVAAEQEIAFPVARHRTILDLRRPLTDRDRTGNTTMVTAYCAEGETELAIVFQG